MDSKDHRSNKYTGGGMMSATLERANPAWALAAGAVAGMRSMTAPAVVSFKMKRIAKAEGLEHPTGLSGGRVGTGLALAALGELVADKLPKTPNRTDPPALIMRGVSGAFAGAALSGRKRNDRIKGAVLGGLAAIGVGYGMYYLRAWLGRKSGVPDAVLAIGEDAVALTLALKAIA
jgi:uncharacterized membrane protein